MSWKRIKFCKLMGRPPAIVCQVENLAVNRKEGQLGDELLENNTASIV